MLLLIVTTLVFLLLTRVYIVLFNPSSKPRKRRDGEKCVLAVFLGSGGHTSEALTLVSALDFSRYSPRIYIVSEEDTLSASKAMSLEHCKASGSYSRPNSELEDRSNYRILTIPRARRVHQSIWAVLPTFTRSLTSCIYLISIAPLLDNDAPRASFADLLILNGPGTCVTLCAAVMVNKVSSDPHIPSRLPNESATVLHSDRIQLLGLPHPEMMYVESYARVRSLSLSGKILRYCVDRWVHPNGCFLDDVDPSAAFLFSGRPCYQAAVVKSAADVWFDAIHTAFCVHAHHKLGDGCLSQRFPEGVCGAMLQVLGLMRPY